MTYCDPHHYPTPNIGGDGTNGEIYTLICTVHTYFLKFVHYKKHF